MNIPEICVDIDKLKPDQVAISVCDGDHCTRLPTDADNNEPKSKTRKGILSTLASWFSRDGRYGQAQQSSDEHVIKLHKQSEDNTWYEDQSVTNGKHNDTTLGKIPEYVLEYAPLVHLFSGEQYWPCDIAEHLDHVTPFLNYTPMQSEYHHLQLNELDRLNRWPRDWVFLTSNDNPEEHPQWLEGAKNIPVVPDDKQHDFSDNEGWVHHPGRTYAQGLKDTIEELKQRYSSDQHKGPLGGKLPVEADTACEKSDDHMAKISVHLENELKQHTNDEIKPKQIRGGRSDAPAILIVVDKGDGIVDAFWFFFYSFNLGNSVFNIRFGNHVGDWEHSAVRFHNGTPQAVFFSEHSFGSVYSYEAVEKLGKRPIIYSATGTHAMYATAGLHPYILPYGILHDETDKGPLWDPLLNSHSYTYNYTADVFKPSTRTPTAPIGWLHFDGRWGDKVYPLGDSRQYRFAGQLHYVSGPLGPKFKQLDRKNICAGPQDIPCIIKNWLPGPLRMQRWQDRDDGGDQIQEDSINI